MTDRAGMPWRPTAAHLRAALLGVGGALAALLLRRPDVLALAVPFLLIAAWGRIGRPTTRAGVTFPESQLLTTDDEHLVAGQVITHVPDECDVLVLGPPRSDHVDHTRPARDGGLVLDARRTGGPIRLTWRVTRWGEHSLAPTGATAYSSFLAFADNVRVHGDPTLTVTPTPLPLARLGPLPTRRGLPGANPSTIVGTGMDLAEIRPFQPGDEARRIHWPSSSRLGELHVVATTRDVEATIELVLDVTHLSDQEVDTTVPLVAGLASQLLARGERVALTVLGSGALPQLRAGRGRAQDARIRGLLARVEPGAAVVHEDFHLLRELRRPTRPADITIGIGRPGQPLSGLLARRRQLGARAVILDVGRTEATRDQDATTDVVPVIPYTDPASVLAVSAVLRPGSAHAPGAAR